MRACRLAAQALLAGLLCVLTVACATPVFRNVADVMRIAPLDVQQDPDRYTGATVLWGGRIVAFDNHIDRSEVEILAFPLDRDRQPLTDAPGEGRFVLVLPGYVDASDYAVGRHLSMRGTLAGTRSGHVQDQPYLHPVVRAEHVHAWPWGFMLDREPRIRVGVGVGIR